MRNVFKAEHRGSSLLTSNRKMNLEKTVDFKTKSQAKSAVKVVAKRVYTANLKQKSLTEAEERVTSADGCRRVSVGVSVQQYSVQFKGYNLIGVTTGLTVVRGCRQVSTLLQFFRQSIFYTPKLNVARGTCLLLDKGGSQCFFRAFALASLKPKKSVKARRKKIAKKAKAPSTKEKTRIRSFSSPHSGNPVSEPKAAWQEESKGLE
jgi:hypothetical protein